MVGTGGWGYVRAVAALAVVLVAAMMAAGCGSSDSSDPVSFDGTGYPNGDLANTQEYGRADQEPRR
jgi:major membrane immunogen (membrane-anchored lipoprotein)